MDISGSNFMFLKNKPPRISEAKIKESIFENPQIRELTKNRDFQESLKGIAKAAWKYFKKVVTEYRGKIRSKNYGELWRTVFRTPSKL